MSKNDFEGSLVLEKLAQVGLVDQFYDAVDSDDFELIKKLLKKAHVSKVEMNIVLEKIANGSE